MWLCTQHGFCSIVRKNQPGQAGRAYQLRTRCQGDAENFAGLLQLPARRIVETPAADYRWRLHLSARELGKLFECLSRSIDYPNFKDQVARRPDQVGKLKAYRDFWAAMVDCQHAPAGRR